MKDCDICKILENKESFRLVYEDELCFAILHESPAVPGHTLVIPKQHAPIIEELDDNSAQHIFVIANKVSSALFDSLGAHGTNIILNNGVSAGQELPHVVVNVLPRKENDGLDLDWQGKKAGESELKAVQSMIRNFSEQIFAGKDVLPNVKLAQSHGEQGHMERNDGPEAHQQIERPAHSKHSEHEKPKEDYLVKSLRRMP
jgi:histidine triad (HIT) family protein